MKSIDIENYNQWYDKIKLIVCYKEQNNVKHFTENNTYANLHVYIYDTSINWIFFLIVFSRCIYV